MLQKALVERAFFVSSNNEHYVDLGDVGYYIMPSKN